MVENNQKVEITGTASKQVVPESHTITEVDDISLLPDRIPPPSPKIIDYWAVKGLYDFHDSVVKSLDAKSAIQKVGWKCTPAIFERRNGEVVISS